MATYDLYSTDTGALIRSQSFASAPASPEGKPWAWKVQASLSPSGSQEIVWDETTKARVLVPKDLDARKATMTTAINDERDRRIYTPIAAVDIKGDASVMVEPDIRNATDRANLVALHTRALALKDAGVTAAVVKFGAADNVEYTMTPAEMMAVAQAPFDRASGLFSHARDMKASVAAAAGHAALDVINVETGAIILRLDLLGV